MGSLKDYFMLDPGVHFLNHGSFGATPRPVFEIYQDWQRKLEFEPIRFFGTLGEHFKQSRIALGKYINSDPNDVVFVTNATYGVNVVSRSLKLKPGDEILTTNHEYGACNFAWEFACKTTGASYIYQPIKLPVSSTEEIVEQFWQGVTPRTKVIYLSHVTSPTAIRFPIEPIIKKARENGILTMIDGAHAPGQYMLDMQAIGADFYTGNCHKWLMAPKGSGFLYARREHQNLIEPLIVSWGYQPKNPPAAGSSYYIDWLQMFGTRDYASHLTFPALADFRKEHQWDEKVSGDCHKLLQKTLHEIEDITGMPMVYPDSYDFYSQMGYAPLPKMTDLNSFGRRLWEEFHIEIPVITWNDFLGYRISVQGYNTQEDMDALINATKIMLKEYKA